MHHEKWSEVGFEPTPCHEDLQLHSGALVSPTPIAISQQIRRRQHKNPRDVAGFHYSDSIAASDFP